MTNFQSGWLQSDENTGVSGAKDYSLDKTISRITPESIEDEAKNIRLVRVVLFENDSSDILKRRLRLVSAVELKAELEKDKVNSKKTPYLFLTVAGVVRQKNEEDKPTDKNQDLIDKNQDLIDLDKTFQLPSNIDLQKWFCKVPDQESIPTCTAHAGIALMEYFQNRISEDIDYSTKDSYLSWRFLYKVTRNLMLKKRVDEQLHKNGQRKRLSETDGATIRQTLKAMALFGVPPENPSYWLSSEIEPNKDYFVEEPSNFLYAYAQNYQASNYFRLDRLSEDKEANLKLPKLIKIDGHETDEHVTINQLILIQVRIAIASGFPCIFGINDVSIFEKEDVRKVNNKILETGKGKGGHALVAVGYDDSKRAFKVRNSWGSTWGEDGYGWLPYEYLLSGDATNWWSMLDAEWIDFGKLGLNVRLDGQLEPLLGIPTSGPTGGRWWTSLSPFK
jgi:C1A family cysteine protease